MNIKRAKRNAYDADEIDPAKGRRENANEHERRRVKGEERENCRTRRLDHFAAAKDQVQLNERERINNDEIVTIKHKM